MSNVIYGGIDPGLHGAVSFKDGDKVVVFDPPLKKTKTGKKDYDIEAMASILRQYSNKKVIMCIEAVFSMSGQGVSSSFNFGRGKGIWEGMCYAFEFKVHMVSPQAWKKHFDLIQHKDKDNKPKTEKDKKEEARQKRLYKAAAKEKSRNLAKELCPELSDKFKTVNSDGRAEAVLIAFYAENVLGDKNE